MMFTVRQWLRRPEPSRASLEARNAQLTAENAALKRRFQPWLDVAAQEPRLALEGMTAQLLVATAGLAAHYGEHSPAMQAKADQLLPKLRAGDLDPVIRSLRKLNGGGVAAYLATNRACMDYPRFRAAGFSITMARVESGCKNVVGARLKRGGMHWSLGGANRMLALVTCIASDRLDAFYAQASRTAGAPSPGHA